MMKFISDSIRLNAFVFSILALSLGACKDSALSVPDSSGGSALSGEATAPIAQPSPGSTEPITEEEPLIEDDVVENPVMRLEPGIALSPKPEVISEDLKARTFIHCVGTNQLNGREMISIKIYEAGFGLGPKKITMTRKGHRDALLDQKEFSVLELKNDHKNMQMSIQGQTAVIAPVHHRGQLTQYSIGISLDTNMETARMILERATFSKENQNASKAVSKTMMNKSIDMKCSLRRLDLADYLGTL